MLTNRVVRRGLGARRVGLSVIVVSLLLPISAAAQFTEVGAQAGIQFEQFPEEAVPYGGGAVWADFDGDDWPDLYATQIVGCNRLFLNNQDGTFTEVANAAGAASCGDTSRGATAADFDNDGDQDLYVTNMGQNRLYRNLLAGTGSMDFVDHTVAVGMDNDGGANSSSAVWGDYDKDGYLDLYVGNHKRGGGLECEADLVYHGNGDGTFSEVGYDLGIALSGTYNYAGCGLAGTWSDYDNDGDVDLLVVNDLGPTVVPNRLFRNDGAGGPGGWQLTDVSEEAGFDYEMFGMGIAIGDINLDGYFEYYMADIGANDLALNMRDGTFAEVAALADVEADDSEIYGANGLVSWGGVLVDLDHDGWEDLVVANGGAPQEIFPDVFGEGYVNINPNYVYWNRTNQPFLEIHEPVGIDDVGYFRNVSFVDYDGDGDLDLHFGVLAGVNRLYRNDVDLGRNWLQVRAIGTQSNRDAVGSRVAVTVGGLTMIREVDGGSTMLSLNDRTLHFGLGSNTAAERVEIQFPSGEYLQFDDVAAGQIFVIVEPDEDGLDGHSDR